MWGGVLCLAMDAQSRMSVLPWATGTELQTKLELERCHICVLLHGELLRNCCQFSAREKKEQEDAAAFVVYPMMMREWYLLSL